MKFRIIENRQGFIIQKKYFGLFWINYSEPDYYWDDYVFGWRKGNSTVWIHHSLMEAKESLERIKQFPIKYKNHRITYGIWNYTIKYIDLDSLKCHESSGYLYYDLGSSNLEDLKRRIDEFERKKEYNKNKNKIINIYKD